MAVAGSDDDPDAASGSVAGGPAKPATVEPWPLRLLRHPLLPTLVAVAFGAWLIPSWFQRSQDRQAELKVKSDLVDQVATTATTTVRHAIVLIANRKAFSSQALTDDYFATKQAWLVDLALVRTKMSTYFPDLERGWYDYSDVVTSFVAIPQPGRASQPDVAQIKDYVDTHDAAECADGAPPGNFDTQNFCALRHGIDWAALRKVGNTQFTKAYGDLGQLLLIYRDRFIATVNRAGASGFQTSWPF